jgi:hypothetical protein
LPIATNQQSIVVNFHQDFASRTHNDFFQGRTDRGPFFWPNQSGKARLFKEEEESSPLGAAQGIGKPAG